MDISLFLTFGFDEVAMNMLADIIWWSTAFIFLSMYLKVELLSDRLGICTGIWYSFPV